MAGLPAAMLLLADSRLPAGAHAHSGGLAPAVTDGTVSDDGSLAAFLRGRLRTAGLVTSAVAARTAALVVALPPDDRTDEGLEDLDAEVDARTPSPAARAASRAQGRGLLRAASTAWPSPVHALLGARPHAPCALGVAAVAAGGGPEQAAALAALWSVTGPASAAVRLLGLDPLGVTALLARLAPDVDAVAGEGSRYADLDLALPSPSAPLLDVLAQAHARADVRLFAS